MCRFQHSFFSLGMPCFGSSLPHGWPSMGCLTVWRHLCEVNLTILIIRWFRSCMRSSPTFTPYIPSTSSRFAVNYAPYMDGIGCDDLSSIPVPCPFCERWFLSWTPGHHGFAHPEGQLSSYATVCWCWVTVQAMMPQHDAMAWCHMMSFLLGHDHSMLMIWLTLKAVFLATAMLRWLQAVTCSIAQDKQCIFI